jgi:hypothetical protein
MTYWMDVEAWTDGAYQLSPQEFKVYFCISMMIAQNDGTLVRHDRALARACNDPGKTRRVDHFRKQLNKLLRTGFLEMSQDGGLDSPLVRGQARRREQQPWE